MVKGTRESIVDAFFRLAEKYPLNSSFSMTEIAKEAGITRQAIYQKHFRNTDEIINYIHQIVDDEIKETYYKYGRTKDINPFSYVADYILPLIYQGREWIRILYVTNIDPSWKNFLASTYTNWGLKQLTPNRQNFGFSDDIMINLVVNMTMTIIEAWITQETPLPPDEFKPKFLKIIQTPLNDYLDF